MLQHRRYRKMEMGATDVREGISHHVLPGARPKKAVVRTKVTQRNKRIDTFVDILGPRPPAPSTASPWGKGAHGLEKRLRQPTELAPAEELLSCLSKNLSTDQHELEISVSLSGRSLLLVFLLVGRIWLRL